jgi:hypothetical protein
MEALYWTCENEACEYQIPVESFDPARAMQYRHIRCPRCQADYVVQNLELKPCSTLPATVSATLTSGRLQRFRYKSFGMLVSRAGLEPATR